MAKRMGTTGQTKIALMAGASVLAGASALTPAQASDIDPAAAPATIEAPLAAIDQSTDLHNDQKSMTPKKWALLAVGAGALAGLVKLLGAGNVVRAAGKTARRAAEVSGKAAAGAGRAIGRAVASPLRFSALLAGLALFTLTGLWLYDIEWIGGLIAGAAMAGLFAYGATKTSAVFRRINPLN